MKAERKMIIRDSGNEYVIVTFTMIELLPIAIDVCTSAEWATITNSIYTFKLEFVNTNHVHEDFWNEKDEEEFSKISPQDNY